MQVKSWNVPIRAAWHRANELVDMSLGRGGLRLRLVEDETEQVWLVTFSSVQALKSTTEECAAPILTHLPEHGGFFEVVDSAWIDELGRGREAFLDDARHYVICCYDEIIEVVGNGSSIEKVQS